MLPAWALVLLGVLAAIFLAGFIFWHFNLCGSGYDAVETACSSDEVSGGEAAAEDSFVPLKKSTSPVTFADPRFPGQRNTVGVIGFYHPGYDEPWDVACGCGFLGNFWPIPGGLALTATTKAGAKTEHSFTNAEAAFQALKFWDRAAEFERVDGVAAFRLKRKLQGQEDFSYGKYGGNWKGMLAVLHAKFAPGGKAARLLQGTGADFLLEHNSTSGRDSVWSDNKDGSGKNWLGMQCMLVRDTLNGTSNVADSWTAYIRDTLRTDLSNGDQPDDTKGLWQNTVRNATQELCRELNC